MGYVPPPPPLKEKDWLEFYMKCESGWQPKGWNGLWRKISEKLFSITNPDWFNYRIYLRIKAKHGNCC